MSGLKREFDAWIGSESQFFNLLGQNAFDGLWYWDLKNPKLGYLNDKLWHLLGYDTAPVEDQPFQWSLLLDQDNLQLILEAYQKHRSNPTQFPFNVDVVCKHARGHTLMVNFKGAIAYDEAGKPNRLKGMAICLDKYLECKEQLTQKNDQYHNVIKGAKLGIWEGNLKTGAVVCNERWAEMIGYSLEELAPTTVQVFHNLVHPEDRKDVKLSLENHIKQNGAYELEYRMRHKMGHWVWILCRGEITKYDDYGQAEVVSGMHYDITQRKKNELLLAKYKDLLERSNEAAKVGHWEIDLQHNKIYWCKVTRQIHGVSADYNPSIENGLSFIVEGENRSRIEALIEKAMEKPIEFEELVRLKANDGVVKWVRIIGLSEFSNGSCRRVYGLLQDVDHIEKAQLKIKLREEQFRQTFNHSTIGMAFVSKDVKLMHANPSFCRIHGYTEAELQQMNLTDVSHPEDLERYKDRIDELIQGKRQHIEMDYRFIHKQGTVVWTHTSMSAITNEEGEIMHFVSQVQDISKRKQNELLLQHNAELISRINDVANIGIWEMDIAENTLYWSPMIKEMAGVPEDYVPTLEDVYGFFKEGTDRQTMKRAMKMAMEEGKGFNHVLQVISTTGKIFWSRTIGIPDYKNGKCTRLYGFFQDVDKETVAAKELAIKEEESRLTFEHAPYGMAVIDLNGSLQKANITLTNIMGYSESEMKELSFYDVTHPDDIERTAELMAELMERKRDSYKMEKRYIHKNGQVIWANVSLAAVKNEKGEALHFVSQVEDISQRKKDQILLLNYKNRLEQSHVIGRLGSWEMDPESKIVVWSDNLRRILEVDDYLPQGIEYVVNTFVQEKDRAMMFKTLQYAIDNGEKFDFELELKTGVGNLKWMRMIGVPEFKNAKCVRLSGLVQDINENKRTQLDLIFSEEVFRKTFEHAAIGMMVLNLDGELQKVNPKICEILGYTEPEILNKTIFQLTHEEEREMTFGLLQEISEGKRESYRVEKRYIHASGRYVWVQVALAAARNDSGEFTHLVSQIQDISDKKLLTDNLTEHNNRLVNFAHIVSHNLRSHTSNISMLLDLAEQDDEAISENEYFKNIKMVSDSMNDTICHLNEIVEINSKVSNTLSSQNLLVNVQNAVNSIESLAKQAGSKIEINVDKDINVLAVHAYLESIILNFLTNAIKYKSPDRPLLIVITAGMEGDFVFLSVKDNGLGINMERHGSKLFGMYKTFHDHPDARGMGLFLCKNQVEAMGGKIVVESEVDRGTNFITYFRHENS